MDFFEHQEQARKRSLWLVVLFILAVVGIILSVYFAIVLLFYGGAWMGDHKLEEDSKLVDLVWNLRLFGIVSLGTLAIVMFGSVWKMLELNNGGKVIAESLGGRLVNPVTSEPNEKRLLNVVEEMALASGIPVPPVYLMDGELGINAFAAGYSPADAVIGVTRGTVEQLSRDELQGVIAHEFSHVLNGDMRLNIRLIALIHGILVLGLIGRALMRTAMLPRRNSRDKNGALPILALGVALVVIGTVGWLFGSLIKAAVSRQREFLADASAVQFTRYPAGIAGALKKIGGWAMGSRVEAPGANEVSHMFFGQGVSAFLGSLGATHPPLVERIKRIEPSFDGSFPEFDIEESRKAGRAARFAGVSQLQPPPLPSAPIELEPARADSAAVTAAASSMRAASLDESDVSTRLIDQVGQPTPAHVAYAKQLLAALPQSLRDAAHEAFSARAVIFALLLNDEPQPRQKQLAFLQGHAESRLAPLTVQLSESVQQLNPAARLPLIDLATAALRQLSPAQYTQFKNDLATLVRADAKIDLFEWLLQRIMLTHVEPHFTKVHKPKVRHTSLRPLGASVTCVLSTLAHTGHNHDKLADQAFAAGVRVLELPGLPMLAASACGLQQFDAALKALATVAPRQKKQLLAACAACITADQQATQREVELLRAVADTLDCPMPPLLPGQPLV